LKQWLLRQLGLAASVAVESSSGMRAKYLEQVGSGLAEVFGVDSKSNRAASR
jgi:hypothetical protein